MRKRIALFLACAGGVRPSGARGRGKPAPERGRPACAGRQLRGFSGELGDLAVERGLLSEEDRAAWHDAQLGDFFQNGGYGSILVSYLPGALGYTREEDTLLKPVRRV